MGLVIDDDLFRGFHGAAGEIGYLPLAPDPFDAHHRRLGALEDEIGAAGILEAYNREAKEAAQSAREVFERATGGDAAARRVVESAAQRLGLAIATVCTVVDPELVVLGGRIGGSADLLPAVRATVERVLPLPTRIETSVLAERASLEGALVMGLREARERLFSQERRSAAVPG
jgi:predicted NBD/HSP70 family sugar kinase